MSVKKLKEVLIGSPLVLVQIALLIYMAIFGIKACFQVFGSSLVQWTYSFGILYTLVFALVSLIRVFITEPGKVSPALVEKLKNQLLLPKQLEKLDTIIGDLNKRQYVLKCMNGAIAKHVARRPNSALN